ncbi:hypothetical protein HYG81_18715 [Natrinema zhouii]|nr:hypothetical protein [Natrinema zhouii]UHQ97969.1 hypothetical protein HYG81_18715 [Natrinema zhouii]
MLRDGLPLRFVDGELDAIDRDGEDARFAVLERDSIDRRLEVVAVAPVEPFDGGFGGRLPVELLGGTRERFRHFPIDEEFEILVEHGLVVVHRGADGSIGSVGGRDRGAGGILGRADDRLPQLGDRNRLGAVHGERLIGIDVWGVSGLQYADDRDTADQQQYRDQCEWNPGTVVVCDRNCVGSGRHAFQV